MPSMKDVADRAGVSICTVSHVLNGTRFVCPRTVAQVKQAMASVGFHSRRGNSAVNLRYDIWGLIVSDIANPFFPEVVGGFDRGAMRFGYHFSLANTNYDAGRMEACVERMIAQQVRGVAIMTSEIAPRLLSSLTRHHMPAVCLDWDRVEKFVSNVRTDYETGIHDALHHLYELGHRRIGFIAGPEDLPSSLRRRRAYEAEMALLGLPWQIETGDMQVEGGARAAERLLCLRPRPTAILAANDVMAMGALRAARSLGLQVPQQLSLVGIDDILFAGATDPPLTTLAVSREDLGLIAAIALHRLIESPESRGTEFGIRARLLVRQSTAPPAAVSARGSHCRGH